MLETTGRMTWTEIMEKYPNQWVGLTDVEWGNASTVKTAVVKYAGKSKDEMLELQLDGDIQKSRYTTPNNVFSVGGLTLL